MGGFRFSKLDIILNRIIKEIDILEYHTDVSQQTVKGIFLHILSADGDAAAVYIPKAGNQIAKCRFLPEPEGPTIAVKLLSGIVRETDFRTGRFS